MRSIRNAFFTASGKGSCPEHRYNRMAESQCQEVGREKFFALPREIARLTQRAETIIALVPGTGKGRVIRLAIWLLIGVVALALVWLAAGRHVALLLDGLAAGWAVSLPVDPLGYDGGGLVIGGKSMTFGGTNNLRGDLDARIDSAARVILTTGQDSFLLGPLTVASPSERPDFNFRPDIGDEVSFTQRNSLLP